MRKQYATYSGIVYSKDTSLSRHYREERGTFCRVAIISRYTSVTCSLSRKCRDELILLPFHRNTLAIVYRTTRKHSFRLDILVEEDHRGKFSRLQFSRRLVARRGPHPREYHDEGSVPPPMVSAYEGSALEWGKQRSKFHTQSAGDREDTD